MWIVQLIISGLIAQVLCKQPHILLFMADDLGWNDVGYHNKEVYTPTLDRMAGNGVKLENYYVQPVCTPSRSQLLTGRYQIHTGMQHFAISHEEPRGLPLEFPTLADRLKACGYGTHLVGKWHLGFYTKQHWPNSRGFDTFYGVAGGMADYYNHNFCLVTDDDAEICGLDFHDNFAPVHDKNGSYATEVYADKVVELVKEYAQQSSDKPLFMFVSFQSPHTPLQVPENYLQHYGHIHDPVRKTYLGMVSALDAAVEKIVNSFEEHDLWKDTLTIFSTDNGGGARSGASNAPLKGGKASLWEGGVKAVGFVHGPIIKPHIKSTRELIHISDWFPTLLNLAGCSTDDLELDGYDVWTAISEDKASPRTELLLNIDPVVSPRGQCSSCESFDTRVRAGLRIGKWKLLTGNPNANAFQSLLEELNFEVEMEDLTLPGEEGKNVWLYNTEVDPTESLDLSAEFPSIVEYMCERLACYNCTAVPVLDPPLDVRSYPIYHGGVWTYWMEY